MRVLLLNGPAADGIAARVRCHGRDGGGDGTGAFPRLQNQTVEYLYEALKTYALGTRPSGIIQPVAVELDEAEMRVLAAHYAGQAAPGPAASLGPASADPESLALGRRIAEEGLPERGVAACAGCHGPEPRPTHPLYPRLSEHHAGYIAAQLELWMTGVRGNERGGQSVQRRHPGMAAARQLRRAQHPRVTSREPLWDEPDLAEQVKQGRHFLPGTITGRRETIVTSPVEARPQYVAIIPGPSWSHVVAAVGTAGFFLPLTAQFVWA